MAENFALLLKLPGLLFVTVESTGACLAWGGGFGISPVDDLLIRIQRALDLDSEGQLVASVLSKKGVSSPGVVGVDIGELVMKPLWFCEK